MENLQMEIINVVIILLTGAVGFVAKHITSFLKKKGVVAQIQSHKEVANIVVNAVEQTYKHYHGEEKMNLAKMELVKVAKEKGLKITEKELDLLLESAVKEMNKAVKEGLK
jgi:LL-H family phage holin